MHKKKEIIEENKEPSITPDDKFEILEYPSNIRQRPSMYLGDTSNCNVVLREIIDNALDLGYKGEISKLFIEYKDNYFTVADNSKIGFSIEESNIDGKKTGETIIQSAISRLHSGTKFKKSSHQIGTNGLGSALVNALSDEFIVISNISKKKHFHKKQLPSKLAKKYNNEKYYYIKYKKGIKKEEGFINSLDNRYTDIKDYSTIVSFIPDLTILGSTDYELPPSLSFAEKIFMATNNKVQIYFNGEEYTPELKNYKYLFNFKVPGIKSSRNPYIHYIGSFELNNDIFTSELVGSVNGVETDTGKHMEIFKTQYADAFKESFGPCNGQETMGLNAIIIALIPEPEFNSQVKTHLSRIPEFKADNAYKLKDYLKGIMKKNKDDFEDHYEKIQNFLLQKGNLNRKQKIDALLGQDIQDNSLKTTRRLQSYLPEKLKDAYSRNREECELFLVEGDSAGSDFRKRNTKTQGYLPLRGVPRNAASLSIEEALENKELRDLVKGIGSGVTGNYNLNKLRYGKIIITCDRDADGNRICALLIGFFLSHCKYLVDEGKVYVCETPFYVQNDKFYDTDEWDKLNHNKPFIRMKGLASLGKYFKDSILNPKTRKLVKVTPEGYKEALGILTSTSIRKELLLNSGALNMNVYNKEPEKKHRGRKKKEK